MAEMYCQHWVNGKPVPCPPACPYQSRPPYLWRSTLFGGGWKLKPPLPLGARLKLRAVRLADKVGCWLCEQELEDLAIRWWKMLGLWSKK